jgi:hypothetical protein
VKVQVVAGLGKGISKRFAAKVKGECCVGREAKIEQSINDMMICVDDACSHKFDFY